MHGQLGQADVRHGQGHPGAQEVAQGAAAGHVRAVIVGLHRHALALAHRLEQGGGEAGGGVFLVGVELQHHAAPQPHREVPVGIRSEVRVDGVAVVGAEGKALGDALPALILRLAQGLAGGGQHVGQKGAQGPLPGAAAHLFVVEQAPHRALVGGGRFQKALEGGPGAGQIVQPGAEDELTLRAGGGALLAAVEQDVRAQDVLYGAARLGGQQRLVVRRLVAGGEEGLHVRLGVVFMAVVEAPVQMDGRVRHHRKIPVGGDEAGLHPGGGAHQHPAGKAQRPVQPGGADHAAVALGEQHGAAALHRRALHPVGGAVGVGGGDAPAGGGGGGLPPRDEAGALPGGVVFPAGGQCPALPLFQAGVAGLFQGFGSGFHRVPGAGAAANEVKQQVRIVHRV